MRASAAAAAAAATGAALLSGLPCGAALHLRASQQQPAEQRALAAGGCEATQNACFQDAACETCLMNINFAALPMFNAKSPTCTAAVVDAYQPGTAFPKGCDASKGSLLYDFSTECAAPLWCDGLCTAPMLGCFADPACLKCFMGIDYKVFIPLLDPENRSCALELEAYQQALPDGCDALTLGTPLRTLLQCVYTASAHDPTDVCPAKIAMTQGPSAAPSAAPSAVPSNAPSVTVAPTMAPVA
eukprot:TRINITY_DN6610_c0_g1_i1.p2 TRINITY_DN6610_c0_g1~~TRINITY_DN6610_c0_g1_i1.p2  ORF type:complete len:243 (-),score=68.79 TRINITY_DN6610_c0_g1_i1:116-844(-)